jgi:hypothetical protein
VSNNQESENYCRNCKTPADFGAKYCKNCGKRLSSNDTPRDYFARMVDFGPVAGITLYSIIQAAAVGYLLVVVRGQINRLAEGTSDQIYAILIFASFLVILVIWLETVMVTQSFRFPTDFWFTILPFFMGLAEFLLILSIELQNVAWWYFSLSIVTCVAFLTFVHSYHQARLFDEENRVVFEKLGGSVQTTEISILVVTSIYFSFGVLESILKLNSVFVALVALAIIIAWLVNRNLYWKKIIKR